MEGRSCVICSSVEGSLRNIVRRVFPKGHRPRMSLSDLTLPLSCGTLDKSPNISLCPCPEAGDGDTSIVL